MRSVRSRRSWGRGRARSGVGNAETCREQVEVEYIDPAAIHELPGIRTGVIAQQVEAIFPDWVEEGADGYKRVTFRGFEALTIESLRELRAQKDAEIARLRAEKNAEIAQLRAESNDAIARLRAANVAELAALRTRLEAAEAGAESQAEQVAALGSLAARLQLLETASASLATAGQ